MYKVMYVFSFLLSPEAIHNRAPSVPSRYIVVDSCFLYRNKYVVFPPLPLIILFVRSVPTILSNRSASYFVKRTVTDGSDSDVSSALETLFEFSPEEDVAELFFVDKILSMSGYTEAGCGGA